MGKTNNQFLNNFCDYFRHLEWNPSKQNRISIEFLCQTNQEKINIIKTQKHFSKSFNILLSPKSTYIDNTMIDATDAKSRDDATTNRTKQLRQYLRNVIQSETEETEDRIERYTKQQRASLKAYCEKAEQDFHDILR